MPDRAEETETATGSAAEYREVTHPNYARKVSETFTIEEGEPGNRILRGPCPRCGTVIDIPIVHAVFRLAVEDTLGATRALWSRRREAAPAPQVEPMMCTCEDPHPGRPQDYVGCGVYWTLTIAPPGENPTAPGRPGTGA